MTQLKKNGELEGKEALLPSKSSLPMKQNTILNSDIATPDALMDFTSRVQSLIVKGLKEGVDYGIIPNTKVPTLYKAGAEKLAVAFGMTPSYEIISQEIDHNCKNVFEKKQWDKVRSCYNFWEGTSFGKYVYIVKCVLIKNGKEISNAIASCSSYESKYIDRPRDSQNTVIKMAQKRAFVAVILNTFSLSSRFTQDMEDMEIEPTRNRVHNATSSANEARKKESSSVKKEVAIEIYDNQNANHQEKLIKFLETRADLPTFLWDKVGEKMDGQKMAVSILCEVIEKIVLDHKKNSLNESEKETIEEVQKTFEVDIASIF